jgi:hypothetical protein
MGVSVGPEGSAAGSAYCKNNHIDPLMYNLLLSVF